MDGAHVLKRHESMVIIRRAAHVIKGAAANLMCEDLRSSAANLESAAASNSTAELIYNLSVELGYAYSRFVEFVKNNAQP